MFPRWKCLNVPIPPRLPSLLDLAMGCASSHAQALAEAQKPAWPINPFPKGMRNGCCTQRVLAELTQAYPRHLEHGQLRFNLNLSRGAVSWSLRYLEANGLVARVHDPRNPNYRRWRAVVVVE
jgi:DNA-binding transcriptional ArsR family regulator